MLACWPAGCPSAKERHCKYVEKEGKTASSSAGNPTKKGLRKGPPPAPLSPGGWEGTPHCICRATHPHTPSTWRTTVSLEPPPHPLDLWFVLKLTASRHDAMCKCVGWMSCLSFLPCSPREKQKGKISPAPVRPDGLREGARINTLGLAWAATLQ